MSDPHELVQQMKQTAHMAALVEVLRAQAESADQAGRRAWILSLCSIAIAFMSVAVAIVAIVAGP
jgi:hypothetical protein